MKRKIKTSVLGHITKYVYPIDNIRRRDTLHGCICINNKKFLRVIKKELVLNS